jgi:hypothetical protein
MERVPKLVETRLGTVLRSFYLIPLLLHAAAGDPKRGHFGALRWLLAEGPDVLAKVLKR